MALGHLANYSDDLAEAVVQAEILPQLVYSLAEQNRFYKKAAAYCLRAVAKHSPALAQAVVDCGVCACKAAIWPLDSVQLPDCRQALLLQHHW